MNDPFPPPVVHADPDHPDEAIVHRGDVECYHCEVTPTVKPNPVAALIITSIMRKRRAR